MRKKTLLIAVTFLLVLGLTCSAFAFNNGAVTSKAASIKQLEIFDDFDSDKLNEDDWTMSENVAHRDEYSTLRLGSFEKWGPNVSLQSTRLTSDWTAFNIKMDVAWQKVGSWVALFFGMPASKDQFSSAKNMLGISIDPGQKFPDSVKGTRGVMLRPKSGSVFNDTYNEANYHVSDIAAKGNLSAGGSVVKMQLDFQKNTDSELAENSFNLKFKWGTDTNNLTTYYFPEIVVDGYMSISSRNNIFEIRDFSLTADGETLVDVDFGNTTISYPSEPSTSAVWRCVELDKPTIYCGKICYVDFSSAPNGTLTYSNPLKTNSLTNSNFELSYDVSLKNISQTTYIGSGFGLLERNSTAASNSFIGFKSESADSYTMAVVKNNEILSGSSRAFTAIGLSLNLKFIGYYNKSVAVLVNNVVVATYSDIDFNGYFCAGTYSAAGVTVGSSTFVDSLTLYIYDSLFSEASDMAINFQGRKVENLNGEELKSHYINSKKWIMYGGVKLPLLSTRNFVQFSDLRYEVGLVPKARFGDSIVRFDFRITSNAIDKRLAAPGYSFARDYMDASYVDSQGIYFKSELSGDRYVTKIQGMNMSATKSVLFNCDINVFEDIETWYTCMIIVSHRGADVYLKKTDDAQSAFGAPKASFTDINTFGYSAITMNGTDGAYGNFYVSNFSVVNIDPVIKGEAA